MTQFGLVLIVSALMIASARNVAEQANTPDPLDPLGFMIGKWEGTAEGKPGKSTVRREYSRALRSKFIRAVHWSEYPPQEKTRQERSTRMRDSSASIERAAGWSYASFT